MEDQNVLKPLCCLFATKQNYLLYITLVGANRYLF